jgi:uncharacterized membrane protein YfcA
VIGTIRAVIEPALQLPLALLAGAASGFVNTLSGGGSYLVLPLLIALGQSGQQANATNRVGVLVASLIGFHKLQRKAALPRPLLWRVALPCVAGGLVGALLALWFDPRTFDVVVGGLLLLMLFLVLWRPERFVAARDVAPDASRPRSAILLFLVGIHGGFIQAGVGLFLLAVLVLQVGMNLIAANAAKLLIVCLFTAPALALFAAFSQVDWWIGSLLAVGQAIGAAVAARFAIEKAKAERVIRWLLIVMLPATTVKLWFFQ